MKICTECQRLAMIIENFPEIKAGLVCSEHYNPEMNPFRESTYHRSTIDHFPEWVFGMQKKLDRDLPDTIRDLIPDIRNVPDHLVQKLLRKRGLGRYEGDITRLRNIDNGVENSKISDPMLINIVRLYGVIRPIWTKYIGQEDLYSPSPEYRVLMLYKISEILGYDTLKDTLTLSWHSLKIMIFNRLWEKICQEVNWEFVPIPKVKIGFIAI